MLLKKRRLSSRKDQSGIDMKDRSSSKRIKKRKRRGNSRYILFFFLICFLFVTSFHGLRLLVRRIDFFTIQSIIVTGNTNLEDDFLEDLAAEFIGSNLFEVPVRTIKYKYENIIRIERIRVRRVLPNKLKIIVREREGFMYVKTNEGFLVPIDKEKRILAYPQMGNNLDTDMNELRYFYLNEDLPIIHTNISIKDLNSGEILCDGFIDKVFKVHNMIVDSGISDRNISEYYQINDDLYLIDMFSGSTICLGQESFQESIQKLQFVLENVGIEPYTLLDFKFRNQVVIRSEVRR